MTIKHPDDAADNRSEAWAVGFLLTLYVAKSLDQINLDNYINRIRTSKNQKLVKAMYGLNNDPDVLDRLDKMCESKKKSMKKSARLRKNYLKRKNIYENRSL